MHRKNYKKRIYFLCAFYLFAFYQTGAAQSSPQAQLISISSNGEAGNRASSQASMSEDGRFAAFISEADNLVPNDSNQSADVFVHDRLYGLTERVSVSSTGEEADAESSFAQISGNGRFVIFQSSASNLAASDGQGFSAIYIHDRLTGITEQISVPEQGLVGAPSIAADGRYAAFGNSTDLFIHDTFTQFAYSITDLGAPPPASELAVQLSADGRSLIYANQDGNLSLYNRVLDKTKSIDLPYASSIFSLNANAQILVYLLQNSTANYTINSFQNSSQNHKEIASFSSTLKNYAPTLTLSADGSFFAVLQPSASKQLDLVGYDLKDNQAQTLATDVLSDSIALSIDGNAFAYAQELDGTAQIFARERTAAAPPYGLSGRVTDASGLPLALVTLEDGRGHIVKTDRGGYFWINGITPGPVTLTPSKEGYAFEPASASLDTSSDIANIAFTVNHEEVLSEAQLDIGMPYNFERGCETPWQGCGGDFHGFSAGYCTDLILDAYTWGVDFNIQTALVRDYQAHPEHFYRWRNARNAHDMWRYFSYSGQMLPHAVGYLPGDIVFFDWSGDGEIDHVSIISTINNRNQPIKVYDATGIINSNPGGLADELPWEAFHEATLRGHARWNGVYGAANTSIPSGDFLQIAVASADIQVVIFDAQGNRLSQSVRAIPNGIFFNLGWEQTASIGSPQSQSAYYMIRISAESDAEISYQFIAHTIQNGLVTARVENSTILTGNIDTIYLRINNSDGELGLEIVRGIRKIREDWER